MVLFFIFWKFLSAVQSFGCGDSARLESNGLGFVLAWGVEFLILSLPGEKTELSHCNWCFPWWERHKCVCGDMNNIHFFGTEDLFQREGTHFCGLAGQCSLIRGDNPTNQPICQKSSSALRLPGATDSQTQAQQLCWSFHLPKMTRVLSQLLRNHEKFPI